MAEDDDGTKGTYGVGPAKSKATAVSIAHTDDPKKAQQQQKTGPASRSGRYYARGGGPKPQAAETTVDESSVPTARFDRTEGRPGTSLFPKLLSHPSLPQCSCLCGVVRGPGLLSRSRIDLMSGRY